MHVVFYLAGHPRDFMAPKVERQMLVNVRKIWCVYAGSDPAGLYGGYAGPGEANQWFWGRLTKRYGMVFSTYRLPAGGIKTILYM